MHSYLEEKLKHLIKMRIIVTKKLGTLWSSGVGQGFKGPLVQILLKVLPALADKLAGIVEKRILKIVPKKRVLCLMFHLSVVPEKHNKYQIL